MSKFKRFFIFSIYFVGLITASSCTLKGPSHDDPKGRLGDYVGKTFQVSSMEDRKDLAGFLTGEAKNRLLSWSDDQFREVFLESKRRLLKLLIKDTKSISPTETEITYEVSYYEETKGRGGQIHSSTVTNKKLCRMVKEGNQWMIGEVRNIKELVDFQDVLSIP